MRNCALLMIDGYRSAAEMGRLRNGSFRTMRLGKRPIEPRRQLSERVLREDIRFREEPEPANMRYRRCGIGHEKNDH